MKIIYLVTLLFGFSMAAQAVVVDQFKCQISIYEHVSLIVTEHSMEFSAARHAIPQQTPSPFMMTAGKFSSKTKLNKKDGHYLLSASLYYQHALKLSPEKTLTEAKQYSCFQTAGVWCDKRAGQNCKMANQECPNMGDPADPQAPWEIVTIGNNIAFFNDKHIQSRNFRIVDDKRNERAIAKIGCKYLGSLE